MGLLPADDPGRRITNTVRNTILWIFWHDAAAQKRWLRRFALLTGVLLLPVLVLAVFARPSADDFIYAARTHAVVQQYGLDLPRLLRAAWDTNVYYYENWQGLYVSGFTLAFQPAIFGNRYYGATLVCVLLPLFFCLYGLARCVVLRLDPAQRRLPWALALLRPRLYRGMPAPVEGLYWFNGAMNYLPYFSLAALNAGLAFALCFADKLPTRRKFFYAAAGCVCSLVIGGGHQVAGLLNVLVLLLAAALCAVRRRNFWQVPALAAAITGPIATCLFHLEMNGPAVSSGMGTCGLVGQIGVYTGWIESGKAVTAFDWIGLVLICFVLPAVLSTIFCELLRKKGWIKEGDLKL